MDREGEPARVAGCPANTLLVRPGHCPKSCFANAAGAIVCALLPEKEAYGVSARRACKVNWPRHQQKTRYSKFPAHAGAVAAHVALEFVRDARAGACLASLMPSSHPGRTSLGVFLGFRFRSEPLRELAGAVRFSAEPSMGRLQGSRTAFREATWKGGVTGLSRRPLGGQLRCACHHKFDERTRKSANQVRECKAP